MNAGDYTKVTLSSNGTIMKASQIEAKDLPSHTHTSSDVLDLEDFVKSILSELFVDNDENNIAFEYDKATETLSAEIKTDGVTIKQNEFGELYADATELGASANSSLASAVETLEAKVEELEEKIANTSSGGVDFEVGSGLKLEDGVLSANIDNYTIVFDSDTDEMKVDAAIGSGTSEKEICGTHTHTSSQITDFEEAVKRLINANSGVEIEDLEDLIDGVTIRVNEDGQLEAVSTVTSDHTHTTADITDWNDDWLTRAINQEMSSYTGTIPESLAYIDFENQTLGRAFIELDYAIQDVNDKLDQLTTEFNAFKINAIALSLGAATFKVSDSSRYAQMFDRKLNKYIDKVYDDKSVKLTLNGFNQLNGTISLYYDNNLISTVDCSKLTNVGYQSGNFLVSDLMIDENTGSPSNYILTISLPASTEDGTHTAQLRYISSKNQAQDSATLSFYSTIHTSMALEVEDNLTTHKVLNTSYVLEDFYTYDDNGMYSGSIDLQISDYASYRFVPIQRDIDFSKYEAVFSYSSGIFSIDGSQISKGTEEITVYIQDMFAPVSKKIALEKTPEKSVSEFAKYRGSLTNETSDSLTSSNAIKTNANTSSTIIDDVAIGLLDSMTGYYSLTMVQDLDEGIYNGYTLTNVPDDAIIRAQLLDNDNKTLREAINQNTFDGFSYASKGTIFYKSKIDSNSFTFGFSNYPFDAAKIAITLYYPKKIRRFNLSEVKLLKSFEYA